MSKFTNLTEAFRKLIPNDEPIPGFNKLLQSAFLAGAAATLRLLEDGEASLTDIRDQLKGRGK